MLQQVTKMDGSKVLTVEFTYYQQANEIIPLRRALCLAVRCMAESGADYGKDITEIMFLLEELEKEQQ